MLKNSHRFIVYVHAFVLILYVWKALFSYVSISNIEYFFSAFLAFIYLILFLTNSKFFFKSSKLFLFFLVYGIVSLLFSFLAKGFIISFMGFSSFFLNLFLINCALVVLNKKDFYFLKKIMLLAMSINALVSIYQYFFDASFFGIIKGVYGNEDIMELGNVTRRTVGFMGSPQSFSASLGVSLFIAYSIDNPKLKWLIISLFVFSGLLSGSRAFGIAIILFGICLILQLSLVKRWLFIFLCVFFVILVFAFFSSTSSYLDTILRNFNFNNWAASKIYFSSLKDYSFYEWIFGRGYGLAGWNSNSINLSFDYSSTESYVISLIVQTGLFSFVLYFALVYSWLRKNRHNKLFVFLLLYIFIDSCFTPALCGFAFSYYAFLAVAVCQSRIINPAYEKICFSRNKYLLMVTR